MFDYRDQFKLFYIHPTNCSSVQAPKAHHIFFSGYQQCCGEPDCISTAGTSVTYQPGCDVVNPFGVINYIQCNLIK